MRAAGLTIAPEARAALIPLLGGDRLASRSELRKLALYAHGKERGRAGRRRGGGRPTPPSSRSTRWSTPPSPAGSPTSTSISPRRATPAPRRARSCSRCRAMSRRCTRRGLRVDDGRRPRMPSAAMWLHFSRKADCRSRAQGLDRAAARRRRSARSARRRWRRGSMPTSPRRSRSGCCWRWRWARARKD